MTAWTAEHGWGEARINYRLVRDMREVKPAIRDGLRWMNFGLRPYSVLMSFDLTRPRPN